MPAAATHFFFARRVYLLLDSKLQSMIVPYRDYYDLGAQGPDIFFFYQPWHRNEVAYYGTNIHNNPARKLYESSLKKIVESSDIAALAYLLGLTTHFTLDSSFHPQIYQYYPDFNDHMALEVELDRVIIKSNIQSIAPQAYHRDQLIDNKQKYGKSVNLIYSDIKPKIINKAVRQTSFYLKRLYSPLGIKAAIISFFSKKVAQGMDFSNMIIKRKTNRSYDQLINKLLNNYEVTINLAVKNINNVVACYEGKEQLNEYFDNDFK